MLYRKWGIVMRKKSGAENKNALFFLGGHAVTLTGVIVAVVALFFIVWMIFQQRTISKYEAEKKELEKERQAKEERLDDLNREDESLSYEEAERKAREELGMVKPGEQILVAE